VKIKVNNLLLILLCFLGLYPLLKFNISSFAIILFSSVALISGTYYKNFNFNKKNRGTFLFLGAYFLLLLISIFYSSNKGQAIKRITQFLPLIIIPALIAFNSFRLKNNNRELVLNFFIIINVVYTIIILLIFLFNLHKTEFQGHEFLLDYDKFQFLVREAISSDILFLHKAYFSMGFVICTIFCLNKTLILFKQNKRLTIVYTVTALYFFLWLFYAFSFPNIIVLLLSLIILFYYNLKKKQFYKVILFLSIGCMTLIFVKTKDVDVKRGFNFMKSSVNKKDYEISDPRTEIYRTYANIAQESNALDFIFGYGVGDVQDKLNQEYQRRFNQNKGSNLLYFNEELNDLYWFKNNISVLHNNGKAPSGERNAELVFETDSVGEVSHNISVPLQISKSGT